MDGFVTQFEQARGKAFSRFYVRLVIGCNEISGNAVVIPGTLKHYQGDVWLQPPPHARQSRSRAEPPMVDCFDRIAVQMTEIALEPVRMLSERAMLSAVTLRTPSAGRRFNVTIEKRFPDGMEAAPRYCWSLIEVTVEGEAVADGAKAMSPRIPAYRIPEDAYWGAVDALCEVQRSDPQGT